MQNIDLVLKPSRCFCALLLLILLGSSLIISYIPISWWIKGGLLWMVFYYGSALFFQYGLLKHPYALRQLKHLGNKTWLITQNAQTFFAEICGDSTISGWVCVLRFQRHEKGGKQTFVIFNDSMPKENYRMLLLSV